MRYLARRLGAIILFGAIVALAAGLIPRHVASHSPMHRSARAYPFVYVAIGASDSYGVGADNPATQSWPADLARRLPPQTHVVNLGVPGILLHRAVETELPVALDAHPTLVTVWLAVNDLGAGVPLPQYRRDLGTLLGALRRAAAHAGAYPGRQHTRPCLDPRVRRAGRPAPHARGLERRNRRRGSRAWRYTGGPVRPLARAGAAPRVRRFRRPTPHHRGLPAPGRSPLSRLCHDPLAIDQELHRGPMQSSAPVRRPASRRTARRGGSARDCSYRCRHAASAR